MSTITLDRTISEWTGHIHDQHHDQVQTSGQCPRCDGYACTVEVCLDSHVNQWERPDPTITEGTSVHCFQVGHTYTNPHPATKWCLVVNDETGRLMQIVPLHSVKEVRP